MRNERPLLFFSLVGLVFLAAAIALGIPIVVHYARTGLVPRYPTAILCTGLVVISFVSVATGLILDLVSHVRRETKRLAYLGIPAPRARRRRA
jgi:spore maturation protein SpmA